MSYGYITKLINKVNREHVHYNNRHGIAIAADISVTLSLKSE